MSWRCRWPIARRTESAIKNTVVGPFHVANAPERAMGDNIPLDGKGESCLFEGRVTDLDGNPIEGARLDVWSDNAGGFYDVPQPGIQPKGNNRGVFVTGPDGRYAFRGIKPVAYPIPDDGPVGRLLAGLGRHPCRPAHMHYLMTAPGFQRIVTHTFVGDDSYIGDAAVFGVKETLIAPFEQIDGATKWRSPFDFVMAPAWATGRTGLAPNLNLYADQAIMTGRGGDLCAGASDTHTAVRVSMLDLATYVALK